MTNRKSQNSILFLTTLGVYLGLVLVGATPQVLAQAATTRTFDISEEVGQVENLDKDPGTDAQKAISVATKIRRSVSAFLADFSRTSVCGTASNEVESRSSLVIIGLPVAALPLPAGPSLTKLLSPRHLARASLWLLFAFDAK